MQSAGVYTEENDASTITPIISNSACAFSGHFMMGAVGERGLVTSVDDLIAQYGYPTDENYNDWFQAWNFLQYGNTLYISRAANVEGSSEESGAVINADSSVANIINASTTLSVDTLIKLDEDDEDPYIIIASSEVDNEGVVSHALTLDRDIEVAPSIGDIIYTFNRDMNAFAEVGDESVVKTVTLGSNDYVVYDDDLIDKKAMFKTLFPINGKNDFSYKQDVLSFVNPSKSKLKFASRSVGAWGLDIEICIALPASFYANSLDPANHVTKYAFEGLSVDDYFEYAPTDTEFAILVKYDDTVEKYLVDSSKTSKDSNNKTMYIENVINEQSSFVFVKDNTSLSTVADTTMYFDSVDLSYVGAPIKLSYGTDSSIQKDDLMTGYDLFTNKEEILIDIVIANELDGGASGANVSDTRLDCINFMGANYEDCVNLKSSVATLKLIEWRLTGAANFNSMFTAAFANYKYQYDSYNDVYRWINLAGDMAGLRAQTNTNRASWWASAGLERGKIKNVKKLAFNPTLPMRNLIYKNALNPCLSFAGMGAVVWGQKTLYNKPSSFDRINVRGLFNTLERSLETMSKYQVMEFNDTYTRNKVLTNIKPYLAQVQAERGIQDFIVVCDETNNTPSVVAANQFIVDIYIKPTYVAEFILLRFTNAGTNSFSSIIK